MKNTNKTSTKELRSILNENNIDNLVLDRLPEALKHEYAEAACNMLALFPVLRDAFRGFYSGVNHPGVFAGTTFYGTIEINVTRMKTIKQVKADYAEDVRRDFHPAGTGTANIIVHELGHCLELALINRKYVSEAARKDAWNHETIAKDIILKALERIGCNLKTAPLKAAAEVRKISGYAAKDPSETVAEAVSDWYSNGAMLAAPLSTAIVEEIMSRL